MISYVTVEDYFGPWLDHKDVTAAVRVAAEDLVARVNAVCDAAYSDGVDFALNPKTNSYISGATLGGFRPQDCLQGAPNSSHKMGQGIDIFDPRHKIAPWFQRHPALLRAHGLAMEHPAATPSWCHLTSRMPKSGKTVFMP